MILENRDWYETASVSETKTTDIFLICSAGEEWREIYEAQENVIDERRDGSTSTGLD